MRRVSLTAIRSASVVRCAYWHVCELQRLLSVNKYSKIRKCTRGDYINTEMLNEIPLVVYSYSQRPLHNFSP